ncbi:protein tyrosine/serine phosphatase [Hyphomonas polymorpha PS728]|uniref:Protein tyrosine/serine phosphatase n=1 Tax=Hyphomonas polymorpha PS728 TaxID=1280954 RepID=A0A062VGE4_9PROT|nr:protein tyrosine/serine phosphatase [Hyphomonas polymorpha PS728]
MKLKGAQNFRDLGGYPTVCGKAVRRYQVFRAAGLNKLTLSDYRRIDRLELKSVFDLRTPEERHALPTLWGGNPVRQVGFQSGDKGNLVAMAATLTDPGLRPEAVTGFMLSLYRRLPYDHAEAYATVLRCLAKGEFPLLFHCAAGKDRTGVLAAIILSLLGVPEHLVFEDYALSARIVDYRMELGLDDKTPSKLHGQSILRELAEEVVEPLLMSHPDYIMATFSELRGQHGSIESFVKTVYGLQESEVGALREKLLD